MNEVTVIITSCSRFDLLERTISSFLKMNTYPIARYILHNDGPAPGRELRKISNKYPFIETITSPQRIGYSRSLDRLLSMVTTEWIFNLEDDWDFHSNPGFIERSMLILEENPDIHQCWIRDESDHGHPLGEQYSLNGILVKPVTYGYKKHWNGWSLNPALRRMSDIKRMFPNGLVEHRDEIDQAQHVAKFNYRAVAMVDSSIRHIGYGRRSINFRA